MWALVRPAYIGVVEGGGLRVDQAESPVNAEFAGFGSFALLTTLAGVVVAAVALYSLSDVLGIFDRVNDVIGTVLGSEAGRYTVASLAPLSTVTSLATVLAVVNVILLTALATVAALLYNLCASLVGGLGVTLTDD